MSFSKVEEKARSLLNLSTEELHRRGIEALLEQELRPMEAELFRLLMRYGIQDVFEMEALYQEGKLEEAQSWEDFFRIDHLTAQIKEIRELLETIRRT